MLTKVQLNRTQFYKLEIRIYHKWNDQNNIKKYQNKKKTERYDGRIK